MFECHRFLLINQTAWDEGIMQLIVWVGKTDI